MLYLRGRPSCRFPKANLLTNLSRRDVSSLTIVVSIKVVGLILVIALLTIPIYVAGFFSKSLFSMMVSAALLSMFFSTIGLFLSYNFDLSSGPSIIIVSSVFALLAFLIKNLKEYIQ